MLLPASPQCKLILDFELTLSFNFKSHLLTNSSIYKSSLLNSLTINTTLNSIPINSILLKP